MLSWILLGGLQPRLEGTCSFLLVHMVQLWLTHLNWRDRAVWSSPNILWTRSGKDFSCHYSSWVFVVNPWSHPNEQGGWSSRTTDVVPPLFLSGKTPSAVHLVTSNCFHESSKFCSSYLLKEKLLLYATSLSMLLGTLCTLHFCATLLLLFSLRKFWQPIFYYKVWETEF